MTSNSPQPFAGFTSAGNSESDADRAALELFEHLHRYTDALHRQDSATCERLLREHPEIESWLPCLEGLENLAPGERRPVLEPAREPVSESAGESARGGDSAPAEGDPAAAQTMLYREVEPQLEAVAAGRETLPADGTSGQFASGSSLLDGPLQFGKYELVEEIARGGMGVVYKARQTDLDRIVALKMILASQFASADEVRRFYAEARAAGSLKHPHIVGIHEVGQLHGQHYFAMDFIDGRSLADELRHSRLSAERAVELLLPIVRAVAFLHQRGIVHRDLKPSNILLDQTGHPYVADLGLAKILQGDCQQTASGTIIGTPSYMSPEQAAGRTSEVTPRSDVYSLGAILYEMLTGRPPFREQTPLDTLVQVLEGEPPRPRKLNPDVPADLERICLRALEKSPERRYACAEDLAADLERFLKHEPVVAQPAGVWHALGRWTRREPALASRLCAVLGSALIVQAFYHLEPVPWSRHWPVMLVLATWAMTAWMFQRLVQNEQLASAMRFAWAASDAILLTAVLVLAEGPLGPLLIGYPLLVVAAGLFFDVRLVWFMTIVTLLAYAGLLLIRPAEAYPLRYPIIFAAAQAILGLVVGYQVHRVRALSRYYGSRQSGG